MTLRPELAAVTERIVRRRRRRRAAYLDRIHRAREAGPTASRLSCGNLAHGFAACAPGDKAALAGDVVPNLGIVTAYNDMLSAHQPYERFPDADPRARRGRPARVAQVAGGVPAMCDGVTQGQTGMELSLFSRDVIAMSAGIALSHDMFDAAVFLGICDKIVPGLLIGALAFGHLPAVFVPAGPMTVGHAERREGAHPPALRRGQGRPRRAAGGGIADPTTAPGTCTFYGTANSNQMLMEIMGLHLPGAVLRQPEHAAARRADARRGEAGARHHRARQRLHAGRRGDRREGDRQRHRRPARHRRLDQPHAPPRRHRRGPPASTSTWDDFSDLSEVVPLLARIYPNGIADVNHFQAAGGMGFLIGELLDAGLLHEDVRTVWGTGPCRLPRRGRGSTRTARSRWEPAPAVSQRPQTCCARRRSRSRRPAG